MFRPIEAEAAGATARLTGLPHNANPYRVATTSEVVVRTPPSDVPRTPIQVIA